MATLGEDRDGRATDATARPGHQDRPITWLEPALLERHDRHRGGEAGRPDSHRIPRREAPIERHDPGRRHTLVLGEATVTRHAQVVAVGEDRRPDRDRGIGARDHLTREVDARDQRADPGDLAVDPRGEAVLEVDARPRDADLDVAQWEVDGGELADATIDPRRALFLDAFGDVRTERRGDGH